MTASPVCIDLSSDSDTEASTSSPCTKQQQSAHRNSIARSKNKNEKHGSGEGVNTGIQSEFIDHVVMIWLNRARRGDVRVQMPDSILKYKAKETAKMLNKYDTFYPNAWLPAFKRKLEAQKPVMIDRDASKHMSMLIHDIIKAERDEFFRYRKNNNTLQVSNDEFFNDPIKDYNEALECLKMVEEYAFCMRNFAAVGLIAQIEDLLKNETNP